MKKILALLLSVLIVLSLAGCASSTKYYAKEMTAFGMTISAEEAEMEGFYVELKDNGSGKFCVVEDGEKSYTRLEYDDDTITEYDGDDEVINEYAYELDGDTLTLTVEQEGIMVTIILEAE